MDLIDRPALSNLSAWKVFDTVTHIPEWLCCKTWLVNKPARAVTIRGAQWVKNIIQDSRNWYPVNFGGWLLKGGQFEPQVCVVVCRVFFKDWSGCLLIGDLNSHWYPRYWTEQANVSQSLILMKLFYATHFSIHKLWYNHACMLSKIYLLHHLFLFFIIVW